MAFKHTPELKHMSGPEKMYRKVPKKAQVDRKRDSSTGLALKSKALAIGKRALFSPTRSPYQFLARNAGPKDVPARNLFRAESDDDDEDSVSEDNQASSDESDWYEGKTLIAEVPDGPAHHKVDSLATVEKLRESFARHATRIRFELSQGFGQALDHVLHIHSLFEDSVDPNIQQGLNQYRKASQDSFRLQTKARNILQTRMDENQDTLRELFVELRLAYTRRDKLWDKLESDVQDRIDRAKSTFDALDDGLAKTSISLDKRSKALTNESTKKKERDGVLKSLLGRL
ncbi:hypothetical protein SISNIDRAFT_459870 [Sistotremastrum niveocremeum HHB9708]|uniref:Uncharacterized protein n=1 Tax=Sistotremastrum niveocremeum HHB9708 TaxID=1314777 RepID=A0A164P665_9AGAM|nr:hypothetical protein SISNIDRAFT_459870 [Sistotremastrum niveocremeum HHB9708]